MHLNMLNNTKVTFSTSQTIRLEWDHLEPRPDEYKIKYKAKEAKEDYIWRDTTEAEIILQNLKSSTTYEIFIYAKKADDSIIKLEHIEQTTDRSPADDSISKSVKISHDPTVYELLNHKVQASNGIHIVNSEFVQLTQDYYEKTIVLLGERKSGKSTLIDAMMNYIAGVPFADRYTLKLTRNENDEDNLPRRYRIKQHRSFHINYHINIIDVGNLPYGMDNRKSFLNFMKMLNDYGLKTIDAICIVFKINDSLQLEHRAISDFAFKNFSPEQIFPMITFDDTGFGNVRIIDEIERTYSLKENAVFFRFNNADLFNSKKDLENWKKRNENFGHFFERLDDLEPLPLIQPLHWSHISIAIILLIVILVYVWDLYTLAFDTN